MRINSLLSIVMASTAFAYVHDASEDKLQARAVTNEVCVLQDAEPTLLTSDIARVEQFACSSSGICRCRC